MPTSQAWEIVDLATLESARGLNQPLESLARGDIPAIILRDQFPSTDCRRLVDRLIERELLYDWTKPVPAQFLERSVPEGHYEKERTVAAEATWRDDGSSPKRRIDVGTSLGNLGYDKEGFLAHAARTRELFAHLFDGLPNPIARLYEALSVLAAGKHVLTAREPDGRLYGPAIVRAHYGGYTYKPHFDSVRYREERRAYAVHRFEHQFAGVLVLQNNHPEGRCSDARLHQCLWRPELNDVLTRDGFAAHAREHGIEHVDIPLAAGDLYFFNTRTIHEVPGTQGTQPRIVLATFIGYSTADPEIFVWS